MAKKKFNMVYLVELKTQNKQPLVANEGLRIYIIKSLFVNLRNKKIETEWKEL